ncbi:MAG: hypothetical protein JWO96_199 [Candidatus Saccharibacteria bacterium]|nr:hypothetical protein [Candidatus Saccharibacteria bacterium]
MKAYPEGGRNMDYFGTFLETVEVDEKARKEDINAIGKDWRAIGWRGTDDLLPLLLSEEFIQISTERAPIRSTPGKLKKLGAKILRRANNND